MVGEKELVGETDKRAQRKRSALDATQQREC
jgi:hypothetical protein